MPTTPAVRRLFWFAAGYIAALLAARYLLPEGWLLPAAGICAPLGLAAALLCRAPRLRRRVWAVLSLLGLSAAAGLAWTAAYTALFIAPAEALAGERRDAEVVITRYADLYAEDSRVEARAADGTPMLLYDYEGRFGDLRPGDRVVMPLKLLSAGTRYGAESDYYYASGIRLRGYTTGDYAVTGRVHAAGLLFFPQELARAVKEQALNCFPEDVNGLMKALLTGDRTEYYLDDALYSAMRTAGFAHIVAVSGMHVAFLVSLLRLLTGRRRITAFLGIPTIAVFMAMTGFTPSVVRAGCMQILLLLAPLLRRENDAPTSLAAAALLILLPNPFAVASASFQLSFAAMAGLITTAPRIYDWSTLDGRGRSRLPRGPSGALLRWFYGVLSSGVGAAVFTDPILAFSGGYVPLYAIVTNLLCLWAMSAAFLCGYAVCLLGLLYAPLGAAAGRAVGCLPRYASFMVRRIARWPFAAIYTRGNLGAWWLLFVYVLFPVTWLLRGRERYRPTLPVCASLCTLALLTFFVRPDLEGRLRVAALDVGQGQCVAVLTERASVLIDCGSTGSPDNAGDVAADYLLSQGRSRVDLLVLTHFHADHVNGVRRLMSRMTVDRLAIPAEYADNDYSAGILSSCARYGTAVYALEEDTRFTADGLALSVLTPLSGESVNDAGLLVYGDAGEFEFLVTGDAGGNVEKTLVGTRALGDIELLVAGHHGAASSTTAELLDACTPDTAFISAGANNRYGHPAAAVLERLSERGIAVRRTDRDGTVSITVVTDDGEKNK